MSQVAVDVKGIEGSGAPFARAKRTRPCCTPGVGVFTRRDDSSIPLSGIAVEDESWLLDARFVESTSEVIIRMTVVGEEVAWVTLGIRVGWRTVFSVQRSTFNAQRS